MKYFHSLATVLAILPIIASASPLGNFQNGVNSAQAQRGGQQQQQKGAGANNAGKGGNNAGKGNAASSVAASATKSAAATATSSANNNSNDAQSSLTLLSSVIASGFAQNGQAQAEAGQVPSLTSTNNFINFCATVKVPITNGQQITSGSCNPAPMGVIAAQSNMPSSKFVFPKNGATIPANQDFTIQMAIAHLNTGNFVNPNTNYFAAPQTVDSAGDITGHSHVVVEALSALDQTTVTDPTKFAFFKGLNAVAQNGILTADVTGGLPAGVYRLASINSAANHQPVLVAVAQHGSLDDQIYFTVSDNASGSASSASSAAASASASVGAIKGNNTGKQGAQGGFVGGKPAAPTKAAQPAKGGNNAAPKAPIPGKHN